MEKKRLDVLLTEKLGLTREQGAKAIEADLVYINHTMANKKSKLYDVTSNIEIKEEIMDKPHIKYLHINENFIILNKPPGLPCARTINTLKNQYVLNELVREEHILSSAKRVEEFGLVHRLDKDTEGVMILSRNTIYYNLLLEAFASGKVEKTYLAIVQIKNTKIKKEDTIIINLFYGKDKVLIKENSPIISITSYKILKEYDGNGKKFAIVEVYPKTGKKHQIRAILAHLGMAIVGDTLYGGHNFHKLCLYSSILKINHMYIEYSLYNEHIHNINNLLMHLL